MTEDLKTFTSRKLDLLDALSMDPEVKPNEFRVAFRLVQHANSESFAIFPSQDRIALQLGIDTRSVRRCLDGLVLKGWLRRERPNRQMSNNYTFCEEKVDAMGDRLRWLAEEARLRSERANRSSQKSSDRAQMSTPDRAVLSSLDRTVLPPKHLKGTPKGNTFTRGHDRQGQSVKQHWSAGGDGDQTVPRSSQAESSQLVPMPGNQSEGAVKALRGYVDPKPNLDRIEAEMNRRRR